VANEGGLGQILPNTGKQASLVILEERNISNVAYVHINVELLVSYSYAPAVAGAKLVLQGCQVQPETTRPVGEQTIALGGIPRIPSPR